jgi:ketosteroid isomerase-like protein
VIQVIDFDFGPAARNRLPEARTPGFDGAVAALETFYYALNAADLDVLAAVWSTDELAQLNNPVGGILRSGRRIAELYGRIFASGMGVQVTFTDAVTYDFGPTVVFAGREVGSYRDGQGGRVPLAIRTSRVFAWQDGAGRWEQLHHHGSIDDPAALSAYQAAAGVR